MAKKKPSSAKKSPAVQVEDLEPQNNPKGGTLSSTPTPKQTEETVKFTFGRIR